MEKLKLFFKFLLYLIRSSNEHAVHSPFVFDLVTRVIYSKNNYFFFTQIKALREKLLKNTNEIEVTDFGAGSIHQHSSKRKIGQIAKYSAKSNKYGELLFRLVNKFQPTTILELGTSLGISGLYLASARKSARFVSIEGSEALTLIARQNFKDLQLDNVTLLNGKFENKMQDAFNILEKLDFVFFDGNHKLEATLNYFNECLKYAHNDSVFVFDDIHWSSEMELAWEQIKQHAEVTVTIDLFFLGIVFFRKEQAKEHFRIRF